VHQRQARQRIISATAALVLLCGVPSARAADEDRSVVRRRNVAQAASRVLDANAARQDKSLVRTAAVVGKKTQTFFKFLAKRLPRIARFGKVAGGVSGASSLGLMAYGGYKLRQALKKFGFDPAGAKARADAYEDLAYGAGGAARVATIVGVSMQNALYAAGSLQSGAGIAETIAGYRHKSPQTGKRNAELMTLGGLDVLSGTAINASAWTGKPWLLGVAGALTCVRAGIEHRKAIVKTAKELPSRIRAIPASLGGLKNRLTSRFRRDPTAERGQPRPEQRTRQPH
jgi:hypothetical protein